MAGGVGGDAAALELAVDEELRHVELDLGAASLVIDDGEAGELAFDPDEVGMGGRVLEVGPHLRSPIEAGLGKRPAGLVADIFAHVVDVVGRRRLHDRQVGQRSFDELAFWGFHRRVCRMERPLGQGQNHLGGGRGSGAELIRQTRCGSKVDFRGHLRLERSANGRLA